MQTKDMIVGWLLDDSCMYLPTFDIWKVVKLADVPGQSLCLGDLGAVWLAAAAI